MWNNNLYKISKSTINVPRGTNMWLNIIKIKREISVKMFHVEQISLKNVLVYKN